MNQCVFLAKPRLPLFSFHNEKTLLPSGSEKHVSLHFQSSVKTLLWNDVPFLEKRRQGTVFYGCWPPYLLLLWLGEILWSDDFPAKSWRHAFYFRKLNMVNKAVVMKRKMKKYVFLASLRLQLCSLYWGKYFFCHKFPVPRFTKSCFPVISELCKDLIGYTVPFHEKTGQRRVFCECWLPYLLLPWLGTAVTLKWCCYVTSQQDVTSSLLFVCLFVFQKTPKFDRSCCIEEKNEPVCFSGRSEAGIIQLPKVKNTTFTIRAQFPGSQQHVSWLFQSCVKTHLWHTGPFHEKGCQGSVLWVLTAISVVTLIRAFCTVR